MQYEKFIEMSVESFQPPGDNIFCSCKTVIDPQQQTTEQAQVKEPEGATPAIAGLKYVCMCVCMCVHAYVRGHVCVIYLFAENCMLTVLFILSGGTKNCSRVNQKSLLHEHDVEPLVGSASFHTVLIVSRFGMKATVPQSTKTLKQR